MKVSQLKFIPIAALVLLGTAGNAFGQTAGYAYAYDNIYNLFVSSTTGITADVGSDLTKSQSGADLNGVSSTNGGTSSLSSATGQGAYNPLQLLGPQGQMPGAYSRAVTDIVSTQFPAYNSLDPNPTAPACASTACPTQAVVTSETYVTPTGVGGATAVNTSTTGLSVTLNIVTPQSLTFQFSADPYMQVYLSSLVGAASVVSANETASISITDNSTGATVFTWSPDGGGVSDGIKGGTTIDDNANLNANIGDNGSAPGTNTFNPTACAAPTGTAMSTACGAFFMATTNTLADGQYTLTLNETDSTQLRVVPEPNSIALLGLGLIGLCLYSRRKVS